MQRKPDDVGRVFCKSISSIVKDPINPNITIDQNCAQGVQNASGSQVVFLQP
uniref:Uncharacterized protein n=1 Tax=Arundo donax TaxID=35708 RepID=A0A0A9FCD9_ARUDO